MPMPISISDSARSKVGLPTAGTTHELSATPKDRERSLTSRATSATLSRPAPSSASAPAIFSTKTVAPAPRGVERVLHGDVVVGHDRHDLDALVPGQFGCHLEVEHVTGVVLDDMQHADAAVDGFGRGEHLVGHRRGEHLTGAGGIQHSVPNEPAMQRLVSGTAAGYQAHLACPGAACPGDHLILDI